MGDLLRQNIKNIYIHKFENCYIPYNQLKFDKILEWSNFLF